MFQHSAEWRDADLSGVAAPAPPVPLRYGFDEADPFQPVLEHLDPELAEVIVEAGAAGMPVLAPMALPSAGPGLQPECGSLLEVAISGMGEQYAEVFDLLVPLGDEDEANQAGGPGCGDQGGLFDWCFPWTYKYNTHTTCTQWSPWTLGGVGGSATCERTRHCTQHWTKVKVHTDCTTTTTTGNNGAKLQRQTMAALAGPSCP
jgi:hypothetical protein